MAQNLKNSTAYAEAARSYREWSQRTQRETTDARNASQDRINDGMRNEVLGGVKPYASPYGEKTPVELPLTYQHYWMDPKGNIVGTNDGSADPNAGAATEWRRLQPTR